MEDVPYEKWADLLSCLIKAYGENVKTVLDLGCGTGNMSLRLADMGYDVTGVDNSEDMLSVASEKAYEADKEILFVNQDMRELELLEKQDCIISVCDCINYLILDEDIEDTFKRVRQCLANDGLFIFDFNTIYKYETVIGDTTIAENREDCSFIWENYYDCESCINEYDVTVFVKEAELFRRFFETHRQRGYTLDQMKALVQKAGLEILRSMDADSMGDVTDVSERIYIVARECRKTAGR